MTEMQNDDGETDQMVTVDKDAADRVLAILSRLKNEKPPAALELRENGEQKDV